MFCVVLLQLNNCSLTTHCSLMNAFFDRLLFFVLSVVLFLFSWLIYAVMLLSDEGHIWSAVLSCFNYRVPPFKPVFCCSAVI